jgi:hypothetical protein
MSPVDICGTPYFSASSFACVPFPEPGGPNKTIFIYMYLTAYINNVSKTKKKKVADYINIKLYNLHLYLFSAFL